MTDDDPHKGKDIVDLEAEVKNGNPPRKAEGYRIRIDKTFETVFVDKMTGREILGLVGKTPESHILSEKVKGKIVPVGPDQEVDFSSRGVERFQTLAKDPGEG
ncbi:MAG: multiubiquitin domain-containing protein [Bacillota bacterium]